MLIHPARALLGRIEKVLKGSELVLRRLEIDAGNVGGVPQFGWTHFEPEVGLAGEYQTWCFYHKPKQKVEGLRLKGKG
jgi:hypothetical protein